MFLYIYFYVDTSEKAFKNWTLSLVFNSGASFFTFHIEVINPLWFLYFGKYLLLIIMVSLLYFGVLQFFTRNLNVIHFLFPVATTLWLMIAFILNLDVFIINIPLYFAIGIVILLCASMFYKLYPSGFELNFTLSILIIWGLENFILPFLELLDLYPTTFNIINSTLVIFIGIGIILMYTRKRRDEILKETSRLIITLKHLKDGLIIFNPELDIALMNQKAEIMTGFRYTRSKRQNLRNIYKTFHKDSHKQTHFSYFKIEDFNSVKTKMRECILHSKDGQKRIISENFCSTLDNKKKLTGYIILFRDITKETYFKEDAILSRNLESLNKLAGGIAHEFNNILTTIIGNISMIKFDKEISLDSMELIEDIELASYRAKKVANQYLTFAEGGDPIKTKGDIAASLNEILDRCLYNTKISYETHFESDLWDIAFDKDQIEQVFTQIIQNATEAMPKGGKINVSLENIQIPNNSEFGLVPDRYVKISFTDTGIGIQQENLLKIFDLYYTTKPNHKGIGLPIIYSIIKKHNGNVHVESNFGSNNEPTGTTFNVFLPIFED